MEMGDDQAVHRSIKACQQLLPAGADAIVRKAGVDDHPAGAITQQPEIYVIQLKRQGHPQPENTGRDFNRFTGKRRTGMRVMEIHKGVPKDGLANYHTEAD